ncbi:MAG: replication protein RepA [Candidatus Latescibacterota bacterium]
MSTRRQRTRNKPTIVRLERHDAPGEQLVFPWSDRRLAGIDVACLPTVLASCYFPRRRPTTDALLRRDGDDSLILEAHSLDINGRLVKPGLPYGAPGRLIFTAFATLAKLQAAIRPDLRPRLYLPRSARAFYRFTHGDAAAQGRNRARFIQHFYRVLATEITATRRERVPVPDRTAARIRVQTGWEFEAFRVVDKAHLWWNPRDIDTMPLFPSWVRLSDRMWDWIDRTTIPLDWHAYRAHAPWPLTMDIDAWLAARLARLHEPVFLTWAQLYRQFVGERPAGLSERAWSNRLRPFKWDFVTNLKRTLAVYKRARVEVTATGIWLRPSPPWVDPRKELRKIEQAADVYFPGKVEPLVKLDLKWDWDW